MIWIMIFLSYVTDWKDVSLTVGQGGGVKRERGGCCSVIGRAKLAVTEIIVKGWARRMFLKRQLMLRFDSNKSIVL